MPKVRNARTRDGVDPRPKRVSLLEVRREKVLPDEAVLEARAPQGAGVEQAVLGLSLSKLEPGGPVHVTALSERIVEPPVTAEAPPAAEKPQRRPRKVTTSPRRPTLSARIAELEAENVRLRGEIDDERLRHETSEARLQAELAAAHERAVQASEVSAALASRVEALTASLEVRDQELRLVRQMEAESRLEVASEESMLRDALDEVARLQEALAVERQSLQPLRDETAAARARIAETLAYAERMEVRVAQLERVVAEAHAADGDQWKIEPVARPRKRFFRRFRRSAGLNATRGLARMHTAAPLRAIWRIVKRRFVRFLNAGARPVPKRKPAATLDAPVVLARAKRPKSRR